MWTNFVISSVENMFQELKKQFSDQISDWNLFLRSQSKKWLKIENKCDSRFVSTEEEDRIPSGTRFITRRRFALNLWSQKSDLRQ